MPSPITSGELRRRCTTLARSIEAQAGILAQLARRDLQPSPGITEALQKLEFALGQVRGVVELLERAPD